MKTKKLNAEDGAEVLGAYVQALEVSKTSRRLYISGQAPVKRDGSVPVSFEEQAEVVWLNVIAQLREANMDVTNIVQATTYLTDRQFKDANREVRQRVLNGHTFALTVVLAELFEKGWYIEVSAIAEA